MLSWCQHREDALFFLEAFWFIQKVMGVLVGFIVGFLVGLCVNAYLLRYTPREVYLKDKNMRFRFGLLNWLIALVGALLAYAVFER